MAGKKLLKFIFDSFLKDVKNSVTIILLHRKYKGMHFRTGRRCFIKRCDFGEYNRVYDDCRLVDVFLGDRSYISEECRMFNVRIGKFCAIGPHVTIGLGIHPSETFVSIHPLFYSRTNSACEVEPLADKNYFTEHKTVTIGHDVWIGANAIINDGVTIGNGVIIGSGAVVTKDIPPYAIAVGVPAKVLRYRFSSDQIEFLEKFCWWEKDKAWMKKNWKKFHDIEQLKIDHSQLDNS